MTMSNPYAPEALASTMGPQQSMMPPLVLPPESLQGGLDLGQQAPTLTQPGPAGPLASIPPPTVADPAALQSTMPPPGAPPPPPVAEGAPPPALPASAPPDANMTSGATGAPVVAPEAQASPSGMPAQVPSAAAATEAPPAPKAIPKSLRPAGQANPVMAELGTLRRDINTLDAARNASQAGYAERTAARAEDYQADADDIVRTRSIQNQVDAYHANQAKVFEDGAAAQTEKEFADIERVAKEVSAMKIDPKAAMPKGVMGNVFAALGAALGAGSAALTGGPNAFTSIMNHAIETQMRADEANIANARAGLGQKVSLYGLMRQQLGDKRAAQLAYRKSAWDYAENQVNALKEKAQTRDQVQKYDGLISGIEKARFEDAMAFKMARKNEIVTNLHADAAGRLQAQERAWQHWLETQKLDIERTKARGEAAKGQYAANKEERENRATYVPGFRGYVSNEGMTKDAAKVATAADNSLQAIERIEALMKKGNRLSPSDNGRVQQAARALVVSEKDRNELGQLTGGDWSLMPTSPDTVNDWIRGRQTEALKELKLFLRAQKENYRRNHIVRNHDGTPNDSYGTVYIPDLEEAGDAEPTQTREAPPPKAR